MATFTATIAPASVTLPGPTATTSPSLTCNTAKQRHRGNVSAVLHDNVGAANLQESGCQS
jgi:hypothetical protein